VVLVDDGIVLPVVPKLIFERPQDHVQTMFLNQQFPSDFVMKPTFAAMLDPSDCCSCQFWHPRSNHQCHEVTHPDLQWQERAQE